MTALLAYKTRIENKRVVAAQTSFARLLVKPKHKKIGAGTT
jgi:hypothetical protein